MMNIHGLFNFFKKAVKEASNEARIENLKPASNKRKNEENFAFDEDSFDFIWTWFE